MEQESGVVLGLSSVGRGAGASSPALLKRLRSSAAMVLCVVSLFLFLTTTTLACIQTRIVLLKVALLVASTNAFVNYLLVILTDPGSPSPAYTPPPHSALILTPIQDVTIHDPNAEIEYIFCHMCNHFKPPRTHHCRALRRCVLRMDHYCDWAGNCIGWANHAHFIRFLGWTALATWLCVLTLLLRLNDLLSHLLHGPSRTSDTGSTPVSDSELILIGMNLCILTPTVCIVTMLFHNQVHIRVPHRLHIPIFESRMHYP
ncbi:DHHC palmitoyltransferase-domain-containing protein [Chytriomyces sp. MP71]|nr:DHHC palmitoyltransferase-domain-containing protein [Chytriomyces sp. MP71]